MENRHERRGVWLELKNIFTKKQWYANFIIVDIRDISITGYFILENFLRDMNLINWTNNFTKYFKFYFHSIVLKLLINIIINNLS